MATKTAKKVTKVTKVKKEVKVKKETKKEGKTTVKPVKKDVVKKAPKQISGHASKKGAAKIEVSQVPSPEKQEIITEFAVKSGDTGSPEVQIALLTRRIEKLVGHLKTNPHDNHSRRGLLGLVSKRRRLINYLEKKDAKRVTAIKSKLGLT